ncbi:MAG: hypothetical protein ACRCYY_17595 [Trueperaceae bacterium]
MIIAIDPGKTTGYAVLHNSRLFAFGTIEYSPKLFCEHLDHWFTGHKIEKVIVEDWENQGRQVNIHASSAVRAIGWVEMLAQGYNVPVQLARASKWQVEFAKNGRYFGAPQKVSAKCKDMAGAVYQRLKQWPFDAVPKSELPHVLDACGLALWGELS